MDLVKDLCILLAGIGGIIIITHFVIVKVGLYIRDEVDCFMTRRRIRRNLKMFENGERTIYEEDEA